MKTVSIQEMQGSLDGLEGLLAAEGEIVIESHGRPLARVLPMRPERRMPSHKALRSQLPKLTVGSETVVREDRDGR